MKHTPGPWTATEHNRRPAVYSGQYCVAKCSLQDDGEAYARLIAAAPDLLLALQAIAAWDPAAAPDEMQGMSIMDAIDIAKQAIAKAEGRTE